MARAEICKNIFGVIFEDKKKFFWDFLTFTEGKCQQKDVRVVAGEHSLSKNDRTEQVNNARNLIRLETSKNDFLPFFFIKFLDQATDGLYTAWWFQETKVF